MKWKWHPVPGLAGEQIAELQGARVKIPGGQGVQQLVRDQMRAQRVGEHLQPLGLVLAAEIPEEIRPEAAAMVVAVNW